jgi:hypothetical protein
MTSTRSAVNSLLLLLLVVSACSLPRVSVKQTFDRRESFASGDARVVVYQARDPRTLDTANRLLRMEFLPVTMYVVLDGRDSVREIVVAAWQELLWRFSERLSPTDKEYYAPVPLVVNRSSDTAVVTWGYPTIDSRDDDLRYITPYRNSYWSIDIFRPGPVRTEHFQGDIRSVPQHGAYDPLKRFAAGGTYARAFADSAIPYQKLRRYLETAFAANGVDSTRR